MKKLIAVIFVLSLTVFILFGQGSTLGLLLLKSNIINKDSIIKVENLPPQMRAFWDSINDDFLMKVYHPFFNKRGIRFDCDKCEHIAIELIISMDSIGIVKGNQLVYEQMNCNKLNAMERLEMKDSFIGFLSKIKYPEPFRNKNMQFRIRPKMILKC